MSLVYALSLILTCIVSLVLGLLGLPGNWLMVTGAAVYVYGVGTDGTYGVSWEVVIIIGVLAILGEVIEFLASALGVKRHGGSKRGAIMAMLGSLIGGIAGMFIGIPIPVVGSIIGVLLFASLGALVGAMIGESSKGKGKSDAWQVGKAAFWGRLFGTLGKAAIGAAIAVVIAGALFLD